MKRHMSKSLGLILILSMILLVVSACSSNDGNSVNNNSNTPAANEETKQDVASEVPSDDAKASEEVIDMGGEELKISHFWDVNLVGGTESGDAAIAKQAEVEKKYNVKIKYLNIPFDTTIEQLTASALSGEPMADFVYYPIRALIPSMAKAGVIMPVDDFFDFNDQRWPKHIRNMVYDNKHYGVYATADSGHGIWYNKQLIQKGGLEDPAELLQNGQWTWDKYLEIAKKATKDLDGDGVNDQWGITIGYDIANHFIVSNGGTIVSEKDGKFSMELESENTIEALDFVGKLFYEYNVATYDSQPVFEAGKATMYGGEAWMGEGLKAKMGADTIGYVPYPRGPRGQDYSSVTPDTGYYVIPASVKNAKQKATILQDLLDLDSVKPKIQDYLELHLTSEADIANTLKIFDNNIVDMSLAFPEFANIFNNEIYPKIRAGASAATAIQEFKQAAQAVLDTANTD